MGWEAPAAKAQTVHGSMNARGQSRMIHRASNLSRPPPPPPPKTHPPTGAECLSNQGSPTRPPTHTNQTTDRPGGSQPPAAHANPVPRLRASGHHDAYLRREWHDLPRVRTYFPSSSLPSTPTHPFERGNSSTLVQSPLPPPPPPPQPNPPTHPPTKKQNTGALVWA